MKSIVDQHIRSAVREGEGHLVKLTSRLRERKRASRMSAVSTCFAISADQEQVLNVGACKQRSKEIQGGRIHPLQIVQKDHQRIPAGDRANEVLENESETVLRFVSGQSRGIRLFTQDQPISE
jgi:hypothetical protein